MGNFNKFDKGRDRGFGGGGFRGGHSGEARKFGNRSDGPRQMFPATCGKCGQPCEVPFKPTAAFPVFCNNCFKSQKGDRGRVSNDRPRFAPKSFGGGNFGGNQPVGNSGMSTSPSVTKAQFDSLNIKLDKILSLLTAVKMDEAPEKDEVLGTKTHKKPTKKSVVPVKKSKSKKK